MAGYHAARIIGRKLVSPTVVVLELEVAPSLTFQSGQWLDFQVPPYEWTGGFSPASLPSELPKVTLAVKRSSYAPSTWCHSEESKDLGRHVQVQVGGTSVLDTANLLTQPVVFCAGGIGISPIVSMYRYWNELLQQKGMNPSENGPSASFLYSVSCEEELVFLDELLRVSSPSHKNPTNSLRQNLILTLTQQPKWTETLQQTLESSSNGSVSCRTGRFMKEFLQSADLKSAFYLCGPPAMLDEGVEILQKRGIGDTNIHFERWW